MVKIGNVKFFVTILTVSLMSTMTVLNAQEAQFTVQVNSDSILFGHRVYVDFVLNNSNGQGFQAPSFDGFTVQTGPQMTSSTQIINGNSSSSTTYSYILKADQVGVYLIGSAIIKTGEGTLSTEPLEVVVHPNPENIPEPERSTRQSLFDFDSIFKSPFEAADSTRRKERSPTERKPKTSKRKTYKL